MERVVELSLSYWFSGIMYYGFIGKCILSFVFCVLFVEGGLR